MMRVLSAVPMIANVNTEGIWNLANARDRFEGDLWEEARMVEVIGGVENDRRDEDGVDGEVLHTEPVELGHVPAYRWAGEDYTD